MPLGRRWCGTWRWLLWSLQTKCSLPPVSLAAVRRKFTAIQYLDVGHCCSQIFGIWSLLVTNIQSEERLVIGWSWWLALVKYLVTNIWKLVTNIQSEECLVTGWSWLWWALQPAQCLRSRHTSRALLHRLYFCVCVYLLVCIFCGLWSQDSAPSTLLELLSQ